LLLAVAGGLFAQATFTGNVWAGFRATSVEHSPNWKLGWYNYALGGSNQVRLNASYRNEAGTYGGNLSLRVVSSIAGAAGTPVPFFHTYRGWFTMFDGKVKVLGGKWTESEFNEQTYWGGWTYWSYTRPGVAVYAYPLDGIRAGFGVNASSTGTIETDLRYWFGVAYINDKFNVYANGAVQKDNINFAISGDVDLDDIVAAYGFDFTGLDDFANKGAVALNEFVGYYGVDKVDLELVASQTIHGDGSPVDLDFELDVAYYGLDVAGIKKVGIDIYTDLESLSYKPYVRFGLSSGNRYIQLDYEGVLDFETSGYTNAIGLSFYWNF